MGRGNSMPKGTKVWRCVQRLVDRGMAKPTAIRICQKSTGQSYKTGKRSKGSKRGRKKRS